MGFIRGPPHKTKARAEKKKNIAEYGVLTQGDTRCCQLLQASPILLPQRSTGQYLESNS